MHVSGERRCLRPAFRAPRTSSRSSTSASTARSRTSSWSTSRAAPSSIACAQGRVPPTLALEWLDQAGQALDRAHAEGIVHRDVKPANLLLDRDGTIVVSDFGIASTSGFDTLTLPGTVLGTAGYLSPEQARGESATAASDRYGLGVVAFELLTDRRPFEGETAATEALAHVTAPVPSAELIEPGLPDGVDEVLARALAKDPADRPATCGELVSELRSTFRERRSDHPRVSS